jgi:hypothetical protein
MERGTGLQRKPVCALGYRGDDVNLMATPRPGTGQHTEDDNNWLTTVVSLTVGKRSSLYGFGYSPLGWLSGLTQRVPPAGAGLPLYPRSLGSQWRSAAYGTSGGRGTAPPHL